MIRNLFRGLIACLILLLSLLGCSEKKEERITIEFCGPSAPEYEIIRKQQASNFERLYPEVKVIFRSEPGDRLLQKVMTRIAGNTAPDIFMVGDEWLPVFARRDALLSIDEFIKEDEDFNIDDYYPQIIEAYTYNGKLYGLSDSFTPMVLYYNKRLFDEAGVDYPNSRWTWQTLLDAAQRLTKKDPQGRIRQFGLVMYPEWLLFIKQNGGQIWNSDKTKSIINSPEAHEAVQFVYDLFNLHHVMPTPGEAREQGIYELFMGERAAMFYGGRWYTVSFRENKSLNWDIAELPHPEGKSKLSRIISHAWVITKQSKHPKLAWEFVKYICAKEGSKFIVDTGDSVPPLKTLTEYFLEDKGHPSEDNEVYIRSLEYAYPDSQLIHPVIPFDQLGELVTLEFGRLSVGQQTVMETLKNIEERTNKLIKE